MGFKRTCLVATLFFSAILLVFPFKAEARTRTYVIAQIVSGDRYIGKYKHRGKVLNYNTKMRLAGVKIIPEAEKYVQDMLKWRLLNKDARFTRNNIRRKKVDRAGFLIGKIICSSSGFGYGGRSAYYGQIFTKQGLDLNAYLISQGFAMPDDSTTDPGTYAFYEKLYKEAKRNRLGAWKILDKRKRKTTQTK